MAMIRPRAGDFVWSADEVGAMEAEIAAVRSFGLSGVVIGASHPDGRLDEGTLARLLEAAQGLDVTLHRAIDLVPDVTEAMAVCVRLGIGRVLSSGGAATALGGIGRLEAMAAAAPVVTVMPGGGLGEANAAAFARRLPLRDVHASCSVPMPAPSDPRVREFGFQIAGARATDAGRVRALRAALDRIAAG